MIAAEGETPGDDFAELLDFPCPHVQPEPAVPGHAASPRQSTRLRLRIAEARRRLERTDESVERIGLEVGYENTAFFRRVFKRATRLTPGAYRRKFGSRFRLP